jgi:hypothetical protein
MTRPFAPFKLATRLDLCPPVEYASKDPVVRFTLIITLWNSRRGSLCIGVFTYPIKVSQ